MRTARLSTTVGMAFLAACGIAAAQGFDAVAPFELPEPPIEAAELDTHVLAALQQHGIRPAGACSDDVFLRRVYLDLIGTLPQPEEWYAFVNDRSPGKRAALVESLMQRPEFADFQALRWCDVLRVKAEFPVNLWPNAVQIYHRWIRDAVAANMPYDQFARALLTSSGSNFRVAPANFYRALQGRDPASLAGAAALTFMGARLASWPEAQQADLAAFFSRVKFKPTREWKEEIVCCDPAATEPLEARLPDGTPVTVPALADPRVAFADWLISPDNEWFARCAANRLWYQLMGRGIIHEPDDIRPDNPPVNPGLLAYLEHELVASGWDLRHLIRVICGSRTYQQSSIPRSDVPQAEALFAHYIVRPLEAEVLSDALRWLTGQGESYQSPIPEPFTFLPDGQRAINIADGSITSPFLEMFGRPSRDTGLASERNQQPSDAQRLHMLNSSDVQRRLERGGRPLGCIAWAQGNRTKLIQAIYVNILTREPTAAEIAVAEEYFQQPFVNQNQAVVDLAWALLNTKEFLYRH